MAPWQGPRHRSWASNTNQATVALAIIFITWLAFEVPGEAPATLNALLGATAGIWFGAVAGDKARRDQDTTATAQRAEAKVDRLVEKHPEVAEDIAEPSDQPEGGKP